MDSSSSNPDHAAADSDLVGSSVQDELSVSSQSPNNEDVPQQQEAVPQQLGFFLGYGLVLSEF